MKRARILVVGSSNTDMIIRLDRIPRPGETILGGAFATAAGGKGANQAVAAARAGGRVTFVARVGSDVFGEQAVTRFVRDGINVEHVQHDAAAASGVALIFVAKDGENAIAVASGANARLSPADVERAAPAFHRADVLVLQLETPLATVRKAIDLAAGSSVRVVLNPAPARPLPAALLRRVQILTPNESEAGLLSGIRVSDERSAARAAARLRAMGVQTVVITLGARGAFVLDDEGGRLVRGFKVRAVDTTAAGDVFNGALAVAIAEGRALDEAVRFANGAAALSVTKRGAQPSAPHRPEIDRFLKRQ